MNEIIIKDHSLTISGRKLNGSYIVVWVNGICVLHLTEVRHEDVKPAIKKVIKSHSIDCKSLCKNGWCQGCGLSESNVDFGCYFFRQTEEEIAEDQRIKALKDRVNNRINFKLRPQPRNNNYRVADYFSRFFPELVINEDGERFIHCHYCRDKTPIKKITRDHVVPKSKGGKLTFDNVVPACISCNQNKASFSYHSFKKRFIPS